VGRPLETALRGVPKWLVLAPVGVLLLYGAAPGWASGFREDEVHCEEAKAHLLDCCDPFTGQLACEYDNRGCGTTYPDLSVSESEEIQAASCDELRSSGLCETNFMEMP
jgi:hypothetical protein